MMKLYCWVLERVVLLRYYEQSLSYRDDLCSYELAELRALVLVLALVLVVACRDRDQHGFALNDLLDLNVAASTWAVGN